MRALYQHRLRDSVALAPANILLCVCYTAVLSVMLLLHGYSMIIASVIRYQVVFRSCTAGLGVTPPFASSLTPLLLAEMALS